MGRFGPYPPSIGHGPAPVSTCAGTAVTLSVTVSGATPFTYQWRKNAVDIPGATASSYSIASTAAGRCRDLLGRGDERVWIRDERRMPCSP